MSPTAAAPPAAPSPDPGWRSPASPSNPSAQRPPAGYRWIAVRPGAPPQPRSRQRPLGPTPRYDFIPRWSLPDPATLGIEAEAPRPAGPGARLIGRLLTTTTVLLGLAALAYLVRYLLLLVNRTMLLPSAVAAVAVITGILFSLAVLAAVITCWVVLTRWLIARRAAAYAHIGIDDPRPTWALWTGCLVPLVNLFWAPVYVIETATIEGLYSRLRKSILTWWLLWGLSALSASIAVGSLFTFRWIGVGINRSAQGIADNTVAMICAYLVAMAAVLALTRVYRGFQGKPVGRPTHRWVVVASNGTGAAREPELSTAVEPTGQEPAA